MLMLINNHRAAACESRNDERTIFWLYISASFWISKSIWTLFELDMWVCVEMSRSYTISVPMNNIDGPIEHTTTYIVWMRARALIRLININHILFVRLVTSIDCIFIHMCMVYGKRQVTHAGWVWKTIENSRSRTHGHKIGWGQQKCRRWGGWNDESVPNDPEFNTFYAIHKTNFVYLGC